MQHVYWTEQLLLLLTEQYFHCSLEAEAQTYAETLAAQDIGLHHCKSQDCNSHGAGENLARAWGSTGAETNATKGW
jgi:hypothetical protein